MEVLTYNLSLIEQKTKKKKKKLETYEHILLLYEGKETAYSALQKYAH